MKFERWLSLNRSIVPASTEWEINNTGWRLVRLSEGSAYWMGGEAARELQIAEVLVLPPGARGSIRASRISDAVLHFFDFSPEPLSGFFTMAEREYFVSMAKRKLSTARVLSPEHSGSDLFTDIIACVMSNPGSLLLRCQMLHLTATVFSEEISRSNSGRSAVTTVDERFRQLIAEVTDDEFIEGSPEEMARLCGCSLRHFSRLFRRHFSVSLRAKQTELRLLKARQLLSNTDSKIINVALESGYRHLGLFNTMFKRHLGMTPSQWRQKHGAAPRDSKLRKLAGFLGCLTLCLAIEAAGDPVTKPVATEATSGAKTNAPATFEVKGYEIRGNTLFSYDDMEPIFAKYVATNASFQTIRDALSEFQMAYRNRGFVTVAVTLPQQQLTNGIVKVQVTEGKLAEISVINNKHFSSNNVMRALPGLHTNMLLNSLVFQQDLDRANGNRDRQIYPVIGPGPDPGTSSLSLKVKDRFPLHGRLELNNYSTPGTPDLRLNLAAQYNNLWQREHQIGIQYNFTPEELKEESKMPRFWDQPLVASYSGFYRMPLSYVENETRRRDLKVGDFGYDEVTHRFRPPPVEDFLDLLFYGSRSYSDTGEQLQSESLNPSSLPAAGGLQVSDRVFGQTLTKNENLGFRISTPLPGLFGLRSSASAGLDYKHYHSLNAQDRVFQATLFVPEIGSAGPPFVEFPSPPTFQGRVIESDIEYLPLSVNWEAGWQDPWGTMAVNMNNSFHWNGVFDNKRDFQALAGPKASGTYYVGNYGFTREQKVYRDWGVRLHADGQWATEPLINNEQFALGGLAGVRGYQDGQEYGDTGWRVQFEPHTPLWNIGMVDNKLPFYVRLFGFTDYGQRYLLNAVSSGRPGSLALWGAGLGANASIGDKIDLRLTVGTALLRIPGVTAGSMRINFAIGGQF